MDNRRYFLSCQSQTQKATHSTCTYLVSEGWEGQLCPTHCTIVHLYLYMDYFLSMYNHSPPRTEPWNWTLPLTHGVFTVIPW